MEGRSFLAIGTPHTAEIDPVASAAPFSQALTVPCGGIGTSRGAIPEIPMLFTFA